MSADRTEFRRSCQTGSSTEIPYRIKTLFHNADGVKPLLPRHLELVHSNPNVYFVRDFLTDNEVEYFDKMCTQQRKAFKHSFTENEQQQEVISEERTSTYTYLTKGQDATIRNLEHRAANIAGLSSDCLEPLQVVAYTAGQQFDTHHDAGTLCEDGSVELVMPRRLVTLLIYLNTLPDGQGHTEFPELELSVRPEKGCGLLFCNVLGDGQPDPRTIHRACPVEGNLHKYAVNVWMTDQSFQSLACVQKKGKGAAKSGAAYSPESGAFAVADKAVEAFESGAAASAVEKPSKKRTPVKKSDPDDTVTEDEDDDKLKWSSETNEDGKIGLQVAAPFYLWVDGDEEEVDGGSKKRRKVRHNFVGRITHSAKGPEGRFYRVYYPQDGGIEEIDEEQCAESIELYQKISSGKAKEGRAIDKKSK